MPVPLIARGPVVQNRMVTKPRFDAIIFHGWDLNLYLEPHLLTTVTTTGEQYYVSIF